LAVSTIKQNQSTVTSSARKNDMPMIDVYIAEDLLSASANRTLGEQLTLTLLKAEGVANPSPFHLNNTGVYIHRLPASAVQTAASAQAKTVRVQIITPPGAISREGQRQLVREITELMNGISLDAQLGSKTWVILTEAAEGGWGMLGTAFGKEEFAALAAKAKAAGAG
jgi:phenylpyruvate tautomerase PptA (4-oxalocrotonate tautomerase family)